MNIHLPTLIYEKLPMFYISSGALLIIEQYNNLATYSGVVLLCAGIQAWRERRQYRAHQK